MLNESNLNIQYFKCQRSIHLMLSYINREPESYTMSSLKQQVNQYGAELDNRYMDGKSLNSVQAKIQELYTKIMTELVLKK